MNSTIVDVVIGMAYVYLLFSLLSSGVVEWVSRALRLRAKLLEQHVPILVGSYDSGKLADHIHSHPLIRGIQVTPPYPTYIPPQHFALALINLAMEVSSTPASLPTVTVRKTIEATNDELTPTEVSLVSALISQGASIQTVQATVEKWFTASMERLSGAYKRKTYVILLLVSIVVSLLFGLDSIRLARDLYKNQPVREALVKSSQAGSATAFPLSELPIGWSGRRGTFFPGSLLTAFALSLGAPFWFDVLNRFANLRQAGVRPDTKNKIVAQ